MQSNPLILNESLAIPQPSLGSPTNRHIHLNRSTTQIQPPPQIQPKRSTTPNPANRTTTLKSSHILFYSLDPLPSSSCQALPFWGDPQLGSQILIAILCASGCLSNHFGPSLCSQPLVPTTDCAGIKRVTWNNTTRNMSVVIFLEKDESVGFVVFLVSLYPNHLCPCLIVSFSNRRFYKNPVRGGGFSRVPSCTFPAFLFTD